MASFSVGDALGDGLERLVDRRLLPAVLAVYVAQIAVVVGSQSQLAAQREFLAEDPDAVGTAFVPDELPLAVDLSLGVATLAWLVATVLLIAATILTIRVLSAVEPSGGGQSAENASDAAGRSSNATSTRPTRPTTLAGLAKLAVATGRGIAVALVCGTAVGAGLVLFVLPGLFLASALAVVYPVVALERESAVGAMRRSWSLTAGHRLGAFALVLAVVATVLLVDLVGGVLAVVLSPVGTASDLLNVAVGALGWVLALSVLVSGYDQLTAIEAARDEKWADVDEELLP